MLNILLFPFKVIFGAVGVLWRLIGGFFSVVFGILGGLMSLVVWGAVLLLVAGLLASVFHKRSGSHHDDHDDFISYYDKNAVK